RQRNHIYDFAGIENVHGLIVMAGAVGISCGPEHLLQFTRRFGAIPMCTLGGDLPGMSSVAVDNAAGVRDAVTHLIRSHDRRRIAFTRGPEPNQEAEERYRAYAETLAEHGIPLDPALVAPGAFEVASGAAAIDMFFDERKLLGQIDAVVAADDGMALGALA